MQWLEKKFGFAFHNRECNGHASVRLEKLLKQDVVHQVKTSRIVSRPSDSNVAFCGRRNVNCTCVKLAAQNRLGRSEAHHQGRARTGLRTLVA